MGPSHDRIKSLHNREDYLSEGVNSMKGLFCAIFRFDSRLCEGLILCYVKVFMCYVKVEFCVL